ncbi:hypothetical protein [Salinispora vitiensis]|uniref:hypothetical protein n=1 Tax=Salinispora vitiensis TaxID=999544 RepID=UPI00036F8398|nr:hypothetical protein [Salinispora vitiensis]
MPLWTHEHGERKRTVPGTYEDRRVTADDQWTLVPPAGQQRAPEPTSAAARRRAPSGSNQ